MKVELRCLALFDWTDAVDSFALLQVGLNSFKAKSSDLGEIFLTKSEQANGRKISSKKLSEVIASKGEFSSIEAYPNGPDDFRKYFSIGLSSDGTRMLTITLPSNVFTAEDAERLVADMSLLGDLGYGIGFTQSAASSPSLHATGITHGQPSTPEEENEARRDSVWFMERISMKGKSPRMRHKAGFLRDVYPLNVLNESHAKAVIDGQDLVSWIGESAVRGTLKPLSANNMLWVIPTVYLRHIRDSLSKGGLLLA
jgi:hypothetical protein